MKKTGFTSNQCTSLKVPPTLVPSSIQSAIQRLKKELQEIKDCTPGKPVRYYEAYKSYSIDFAIMQLEHLESISLPHQVPQVLELLSAYYLLKQLVHI